MPKPNDKKEPEDDELNIGTILRYVLDEEDLPIPSSQVVLGTDLHQGLIQHIDNETTVLPPASGVNSLQLLPQRRHTGCPNAWILLL